MSIPPSLLYQVQQQYFNDGLILQPYIMHFIEIIICNVFNGYYMSCIPWFSPVFTCINKAKNSVIIKSCTFIKLQSF